MTHPQTPAPWIPPDGPAGAPLATPQASRATPVSFLAVYVLAGLATVCWAGAAYSARLIFLGRDMVEGLLSFIGLLGLAAGEVFALLFTITAAFELRGRNSPRAALAAGLVAVTGVVATIVFLIWVSTTASTDS
ncbi:hypothetical protein PSH03_004105 [Micromonospora sp. PSH03]|nr:MULTISPECIES: hypothetical protein [Micromonospora]MBQ0988834.1 hypothetical protein [Micromonospora sp. H61]MCG5458355.1 hypothetical protein [Micromonospora salmantinae]